VNTKLRRPLVDHSANAVIHNMLEKHWATCVCLRD